MKRLLTIFIIAVALLPVASSAFDGNRKGFILGGGIGYAPYSHWSTDSDNWRYQPITSEESNRGIAGNFLIGYAWNDRNSLVLEFNGVQYPSDLTRFFDEDIDLAQLFVGPIWYHYYAGRGSSIFTAAGLGRAGFGNPDKIGTLAGWGYALGLGLEFAKQVQFGTYLIGETTSSFRDDDRKVTVGTVNLSFVLTVVGY